MKGVNLFSNGLSKEANQVGTHPKNGGNMREPELN